MNTPYIRLTINDIIATWDVTRETLPSRLTETLLTNFSTMPSAEGGEEFKMTWAGWYENENPTINQSKIVEFSTELDFITINYVDGAYHANVCGKEIVADRLAQMIYNIECTVSSPHFVELTNHIMTPFTQRA